MSAEKQLKEQINNIIENAYYNDPKKSEYKAFYLVINDKLNKSYSGLYDENEKVVEIMDIREDENLTFSTILHEVAHHIDFVQNGTTGHKKPFYEAFKLLLYSALDLGYIDLEAMLKRRKRNTDYSKVQKILNNYIPKKPKIDIKIKNILSVKNSYGFRDQLKSLGFKWNKVLKQWQKEVQESDINEEIDHLKALSIPEDEILLTNNSKLNMKYGGKEINSEHVLFLDNVYEYKEQLKKDGYHWYSVDKQWYKEFNSEKELNDEVERIYREYGLVLVDR